MTPERWRRIEDLFHAARERAPEQRDDFLARECGSDVSLRRELDSLLAHTEGGLLKEGVVGLAAALSPASTRVNLEGCRLGSYCLGPLLGTGGMGRVYRATDAKLGREVAIKILPDTLADRPDRLARFEREARILAALNHPNIAAIYGLEQGDGIRGLVLELVDGPTLQERLEAGALPLDEALGIARQIAQALDAAHQQGIVHRDLKPANVKITHGGAVKVLDFGLAKVDVAKASGPAAVSPLATNDGVVLGTVAYMSPEQARGSTVDKRTDIWAFGCVLYEMLTGARAFPGASTADVLGAITGAEPDWSRLPRQTPRQVRDLIRRCLRKQPEKRLHDIADARIEIEEAVEAGAETSSVHSPGPIAGGHLLRSAPVIVAAVVVVGAVSMAIRSPTPETRTPIRVAIPLPQDVSLYAIGRGSSVAVSPDGQRIVFTGVVNGRTQLYLRPIDGMESLPIPGTEGGTNPFFSPDGRWLGFTGSSPTGALKRIPVDGGAVLTISDLLAVQSATWAPDDSLVFAPINPKASGLWRIPSSGGQAQRVTTPREGEMFHTWPQVVNGGRAVLYTIWNISGFDGGRIALQPFAGGEPTVLVRGASYARIVTTDDGSAYLVYARPEGLIAARFDVRGLRLAGPPVPVLGGVLTNLSGGAHYSVSQTGLLAYIPGQLDEIDKTLLWVARDGTATEIATIRGLSFEYDLAPDGRRLVRPNPEGPDRDLWIDDLVERRTPTRLTFGGVHNMPLWTADGRRVIYSKGAPNSNLFWRASDGVGEEERLTTSNNRQIASSVSPDGTTLAYTEVGPNGSDIWLMSLRDPRQSRLLVGTPFAETHPKISPDGEWVAYQSNVSGQFEIYLASVRDGRRRIPVSSGGGFAPLWSRDGRELYYRAREPAQGGSMMVVPIDASGAQPKIGRPRVLFATQYQGDGDIGPDGRFLLLKRTPMEAASRVIQLVFNWFDDLEARVQ